jgi:glycosyltransferase involved in cell wall biosynthesis
MKVAIIIPALKQRGPVIVMKALAEALNQNPEIDVEVYYLDKTAPTIQMSVPVNRMNSGTFKFENYETIHTNGIRPDLMAFLNRRRIRYHISTIHNFVFTDLSYSYNKLISMIFGYLWLIIWHRADKLVCATAVMKEYYNKWYSQEKMVVIHNGISTESISQTIDDDIFKAVKDFKSNGLKVIGTAAILTKRKGIDLLIRLISRDMGYALIIIGDGKEKANLSALSDKLNVSGKCFFSGFRNNAKGYFHLFDVFIMPSKSEGFGLALVEAVQQKVPVICSDIAVFRELFTEDEVTFFKSDDLVSLTNAINVVALTVAKSELAHKRYQSNYTDNHMAAKYYKLYVSDK